MIKQLLALLLTMVLVSCNENKESAIGNKVIDIEPNNLGSFRMSEIVEIDSVIALETSVECLYDDVFKSENNIAFYKVLKPKGKTNNQLISVISMLTVYDNNFQFGSKLTAASAKYSKGIDDLNQNPFLIYYKLK